MKNWYRIKGGRNHLANFSRKGLTDFFVNILTSFTKLAVGGLKY
jgi:hypothetical protein